MSNPTKSDRIVIDIKRRISNGAFQSRFPSYRGLATEYNTSLRTISRVIEILKAQKIIVVTPGQGSKLAKKEVK